MDSRGQVRGLRLEVAHCAVLEGHRPRDCTVQDLKAEACCLRMHSAHKILTEGRDNVVVEVKEEVLILDIAQCTILEGY